MTADPIFESLHPDSGLTPTARRVAQFIHANRALALASSAAELAEQIGTSDATVIRAVQAMGFESLAALRKVLIASLTKPSDPATAMSRTLEDIGADLEKAISGILQTHVEIATALHKPRTQQRLAEAVKALHPCERIAVFGIGPSHGLADYMSRVLKRNGRASLPIGATGRAFADDLVALREGDGVIVMAYGTLYREIALLFREAKRLGLPTVLITDHIPATVVPPGTVIVKAMRGKEEHIALHSATVALLEAIAFGLSAVQREKTMLTLSRLNDFRSQIEQF